MVQLLISDFDSQSAKDMHDLKDQRFSVHCFLVSSTDPVEVLSTIHCRDAGDGTTKTEKVLVGNTAASLTFCEQDPDPNTLPRIPSSQIYCPTGTPAVDPQSGIIPPAAVFCFPDLSIRSTGTYRLKFQLVRLIKDDESAPASCSVLSHPFKVSGAKEFDHVQASTPLVRGLIAQGAGFPLKLKKGSRS